MKNEKYFCVDVSNDIHIVELHETLEQAKQSCLKNAVDAYDFANDMDDFQTYADHDLPFAVYGVILGRAISTARPLNNEEKASGYYYNVDEIINKPEIVELNGWISVDEKLPENEQVVLTYRNSYKYGDLYTQAIYTEDKGFTKYPLGVAGKPPTHWQPLPQPPETE